MLFRFSLYGFIKNQRYFEPFLILAFRQKGLDFATIGLLIGFREICVNLLEIPTGAVADVLGRRRAMMTSFFAYIFSFFVFGMSTQLWMLFLAMFLFSIGEAFRTGTHKAMIFAWLEHNNRQDEKTAIYGYTRSWSKIGSAVSVVVATILMYFSNDYSRIFFISILPALANIINFMTYPGYVDGARPSRSLAEIGLLLWRSLKAAMTNKKLRTLLIESAGYEGLFKTSKEYLQPIIKSTAIGLPLFLGIPEGKRIALLIGIVYTLLYLLSSYASKKADTFVKRIGSETAAGFILWILNFGIFTLFAVAVLTRWNMLFIFGFILYNVTQNIWRPILVGRVATLVKSEQTATVLSMESQSSSLFVALCAPLLGWAVDYMATVKEEFQFAPLALFGIAVTVLILIGQKNGQKIHKT